MKLPQDFLIENLKDFGIGSLVLLTHFPKNSENPFNRLMNFLLYKDYKIIDEENQGNPWLEYKEVYLFRKGYQEWADASVIKTKKPINYLKISNEVIEYARENYPYFIVDLRFFHLHYFKEKLSLITQLMESLNYVRDYFLDENFIITNISKEAFVEYSKYKGYEDIINRIKPGFYKYIDLDEACVLDPYGNYILENSSEFKYYIVGGIVDKGDRLHGYTKKILPNIKHCRIEYEGKLAKVPKEINHIIKTLIYSYIYNISITEAIERVSPLRYKRK